MIWLVITFCIASLAIALMTRCYRWPVVIVWAAANAVVLFAILLFTPVQTINHENALTLIALLAGVVPIICWGWQINRLYQQKKMLALATWFLVLPIASLFYFPAVFRASHVEQLNWQIDGVISKKYISNNHQAATLAVKNAKGHETVFERVDPDVWNRAKVGDALTKLPMATEGTLNGSPVRMVTPSRIWKTPSP